MEIISRVRRRGEPHIRSSARRGDLHPGATTTGTHHVLPEVVLTDPDMVSVLIPHKQGGTHNVGPGDVSGEHSVPVLHGEQQIVVFVVATKPVLVDLHTRTTRG